MPSRAVERVVTRSEKVGRLSGTSTQQSLIVEYLQMYRYWRTLTQNIFKPLPCFVLRAFWLSIEWNPSNKDT